MAVVKRDDDTLVVVSSTDRSRTAGSEVVRESGETYLQCVDRNGNVWMKSNDWVQVE